MISNKLNTICNEILNIENNNEELTKTASTKHCVDAKIVNNPIAKELVKLASHIRNEVNAPVTVTKKDLLNFLTDEL